MARPTNPAHRSLPAPAAWRLGAGALLVSAALVVASADATSASTPNIAWQQVQGHADVEAAFARARRESKPVFLYWGAQWCPPCQQIRAKVFQREDFIELSRGFVPLYIDGDTAGAQRLAERFKVRGYPSMLLLSPQGMELTRLPGELDAALYVKSLRSVLGGSATRAATRPTAEVLAAALAGQDLPVHEWRQLAWYAWDTDDREILKASEKARSLARLAGACPPGLRASQTRLLLKAAAAAGAPGTATALDAELRSNAGAALLRLLGDGSSAREQLDLVSNDVAAVLAALSTEGSRERQQLQQTWEQAARRLSGDESLPRTDRLLALQVRLDLVGLDRPRAEADVPAELRNEIRRLVGRVDRETPDPGERQAVIPTAARLLADAGLPAEAQALLNANLNRVAAPHYLMSQLASLARRQGQTGEALRWSQRAWQTARGPATRLQWGASHVIQLVELSPEADERIEEAASGVLSEFVKQPDAYHVRNARALQRMAVVLRDWQQSSPAGRTTLERLAAQLHPICRQQPAGSATRLECEGLLAAAPRS